MPAIDTEYWKRLDLLLAEGLALRPDARAAWLQALPADDQRFRARLEEMLNRAGAETDAFMKRPVDAAMLHEAADGLVPERAGDVVGPWRLIAPLGFGGMGAVWRVEPVDGAVQRQVALKLPRTGWSPGLAVRLKRECDILSKLEHPGIARMYDAGVTDAGRPWLAMEIIDGVPIDRFCTERALPLEARLRLFLEVARAISYAHARLVVHRDLKPSNILVDPAGHAHVVDFGLGKVLDDTADRAHPVTQTMARALTPDYASPEQIRGGAITVATDVYSLGVVLYQLLADRRPYRLKRDSAAALEEAIIEADVPAASSQVEDRGRARRLRGDLDTILAKALRKDVNERYPTIEAFALDVDRHLRGLPVHARPPSFAYTAGRFVRRHRALVGGTLVVMLALLAGLAGTLYQGRQAAAERDRALRELRYAEAAEEFMRFLLSLQSARPLPAPELLRRAERAASGQFADDPGLRARMQLLLADLYGELSDFKRAEEVLKEAKRSAVAANDGWLAAQADCVQAGVFGATGRSSEAMALFAAVMPRVERDPNRDAVTAQVCYSQRSVAVRNLGRAEDAARDAQAALDAIGTAPGYRVNRIFLKTNMADTLTNFGRHREAVALYEESLAELRRIGRGGTSAGLLLANNLVVILTRAGQLQRAAAVYDNLPGPEEMDRPSFTTLSINYARVLADLGRPEEAQRMLAAAVVEKERLGDKRGQAFAILAGAQAACRRNDAPACEALRADAAERMATMLPPAHSTFGSLHYLAAQVALIRGEAARARESLEAAIAHYKAAPDRNLLVVRALGHLAQVRHAGGDAAGALAAANEAVEIARRAAMGFEHTEWLGSALLAKAAVQGGPEGRATLDEARAQLVGSVGEAAANERIEVVRKLPGFA